jgi:microcystin-dependent protein
MKPSRVRGGRREFIGRLLVFLGGAAMFGRAKRADAAPTWSEPYLGEIMLFAGSVPPQYWAMCNGQLLPIVAHQALYTLLGNTYGGDGQTTFALPDLRGRIPIHHGQGVGLSPRMLGEKGGTVNHTLSLTELPAHAHVVRGSSSAGTTASPVGMFPARNAAQTPQYASPADTILSPSEISTVGGGQPHSNQQPFLALNYIISLQGTYPPQ